MALLNTQNGYGALTKFFHWFIVVLFAFQFAVANIMLHIDFQRNCAWPQSGPPTTTGTNRSA
jgi:cytochrome b561